MYSPRSQSSNYLLYHILLYLTFLWTYVQIPSLQSLPKSLKRNFHILEKLHWLQSLPCHSLKIKRKLIYFQILQKLPWIPFIYLKSVSESKIFIATTSARNLGSAVTYDWNSRTTWRAQRGGGTGPRDWEWSVPGSERSWRHSCTSFHT